MEDAKRKDQQQVKAFLHNIVGENASSTSLVDLIGQAITALMSPLEKQWTSDLTIMQ